MYRIAFVWALFVVGCHGSCTRSEAVHRAVPAGTWCVIEGAQAICVLGARTWVCHVNINGLTHTASCSETTHQGQAEKM